MWQHRSKARAAVLFCLKEDTTMKNKKTTLSGIGLVLAGIGKLVSDLSTGGQPDLTSVISIISGIGLIFAKDAAAAATSATTTK
jgi:hypothetical protein